MKQTLLTAALSLTILSGCNRNKPPEKVFDRTDIGQLNDTITALMSNYTQNNDTLSLNYALMFTDELLSIDTIQADHNRIYGVKIQILTMLNRNREAFLLNDQILPQDNNNLDRIIYNGVVKKMYGDEPAADKYFATALKKCDSILAKKDSVDILVKKISIFTYQGKKENAQSLIDKAVAAQPYNRTLVMLKEQYDQQYDRVAEMMKK